MSNIQETWTDREIEILRRLWPTTSARKLQEQIPLHSRNGIISKAHRLNLPSKPSPIVRDGRPSPYPKKRRDTRRIDTRQHRESDTRADIPRASLPPARPPVRIGTHTCQWLDGEPALRQFCGEPAVEARPYCEAHCLRAYAGYGKGATIPTQEPIYDKRVAGGRKFGNAGKFR